ncbi:MAG: AMIN-like domain-containing (lipo)protein [Actinomycetota bacterium]
MKRFAILVVLAGLGLSACGTGAANTIDRRSDGSTAVDSPSSQPDQSTSASLSPAKARSKAGGKDAASGRKEVQCETVRGGSENHVASLVDVRVGTHDGYDRVTFEFAPPNDDRYFGLPLYEVKSVTPPIRQDGSGDPVEVDGESFAGIAFRGASGWDFSGEDVEITYDGPKEFRPGFEALKEAEQTGDYEAILSWAFGLKQESCWTVHVLQAPLRVAIDFSH